jgi:ABC-type dipeptide/oligopeptide/nickel transport system permease component
VGLASSLARLLLDVAYAYLDPRIRYDTGSAVRQT